MTDPRTDALGGWAVVDGCLVLSRKAGAYVRLLIDGERYFFQAPSLGMYSEISTLSRVGARGRLVCSLRSVYRKGIPYAQGPDDMPLLLRPSWVVPLDRRPRP